jgi:hypothetical protein
MSQNQRRIRASKFDILSSFFDVFFGPLVTRRKCLLDDLWRCVAIAHTFNIELMVSLNPYFKNASAKAVWTGLIHGFFKAAPARRRSSVLHQ